MARRKDRLDEVKAKCESKGTTDVLVVAQDMGDLGNVPTVVEKTIEKFGSKCKFKVDHKPIIKIIMLMTFEGEFDHFPWFRSGHFNQQRSLPSERQTCPCGYRHLCV